MFRKSGRHDMSQYGMSIPIFTEEHRRLLTTFTDKSLEELRRMDGDEKLEFEDDVLIPAICDLPARESWEVKDIMKLVYMSED